ncbi:M2 family metallopeptidase [Stenotrophomonas pictorum]|uniref:M2 family metallopeptidase n=1 Tax=Stenotrophomonas pictorum TaxID=86184 RepID=UPI003CCE1C31
MIAAHLTGNMWQQDWSNLWDMTAPYPNAGSLDITAALRLPWYCFSSAAVMSRLPAFG